MAEQQEDGAERSRDGNELRASIQDLTEQNGGDEEAAGRGAGEPQGTGRLDEVVPEPTDEQPQSMADPDDRESRAAASAARRGEPSAGAHTGISNRESPEEEAQERREYPPVETGSPPPQDAAGRVGEQPLDDLRDRHTSHKTGSMSLGQKEDGARYPDGSMPSSRKVAGAFGREPGAPLPRDTAGSTSQDQDPKEDK